MKALRKNVALAVDGGGVKGTMVARALAMLEEHLGQPAKEIFGLAAGTSTGAIISASIAAGLSGSQIYEFYRDLGTSIFRRSWRTALWPLSRYRYPLDPLESALTEHVGPLTMGELWLEDEPFDLVITAFDLVTNHTRFIKPYKSEYADWKVVKAVMASSSVPTYFPPVEGQLVDGGVGSYANPCYLAAYEVSVCLGFWDPAETTLISLGTGRDPHTVQPGDATRYWSWDWLMPILGAFLQSADDQQVHLVNTFFKTLDFRRFQVDLHEPIAMDDPSKIPILGEYGEELGNKILNDEMDEAVDVRAALPPGWRSEP